MIDRMAEILFRRGVKGLPDVGRSERSVGGGGGGGVSEESGAGCAVLLFLRASIGRLFHFDRELSVWRRARLLSLLWFGRDTAK